jgi:hypothetical protein
MSTMESIQKKIDECENYLAIMREDIVANEKYLYNLNIQLQQASAARPWFDEDDYEEEIADLLAQEELVKERKAEAEAEAKAEAARQAELEALEAARQNELEELSLKEELVVNHPVGTKLKWILNQETYRVAIVTKKGVLQVKSVTDGGGDCHDAGCSCVPCSEIALSGGRLPPWRRGAPLKKVLFASEAEWRNSLPSNGEIRVTRPRTTDNALKALCSAPLTGDTDPKKLKCLQERFSGGTFVLTTDMGQMEIEYFFHSILSRKNELMGTSFRDFGVPAGQKPNLMVEWRGLYIGLSHLF